MIRKAAYKGIEPLRRRYTANSGANSSLNTSSYTQAARKAAAGSGGRDESAGITGKSTVGHRKSTLPDSNLHSHSNTSKLVTSKNTNNNSASGTMQQNNSIQVHRDGGSSTLQHSSGGHSHHIQPNSVLRHETKRNANSVQGMGTSAQTTKNHSASFSFNTRTSFGQNSTNIPQPKSGRNKGNTGTSSQMHN